MVLYLMNASAFKGLKARPVQETTCLEKVKFVLIWSRKPAAAADLHDFKITLYYNQITWHCFEEMGGLFKVAEESFRNRKA